MNVEAHLRHVAEARSRSSNMEHAGPVRVAILDDYQHIATPIFGRLRPRIEIHSFSYTLNAHDPSGRNELIKRLEPFEVIVTMRERTAFPPELIEALPRLKLLMTTGMNNAALSLKTFSERGIPVVGTKGTRIPAVETPTKILSPSLQATAEQTFALILAVEKLIARNQAEIANGGWQTGFVTGLAGKTMGILGFGRIGIMVARMAAVGFGMNVLAWSSNLTQEQADQKAKEMGLDPSICPIKVAQSKDEFFRNADVISLHYVLSDRSRGMVGKDELAAMKPTAVLVNTSRGGLIDEPALLNTLKQGKIKGVGLDVFTAEPLPTDSEWRTTRWGENGTSHAVLSPHMGYAEESVMNGWYEELADSLAEWLDGKTPSAIISP